MVAFLNLNACMRARDKKTGRALASGGSSVCDKKEHSLSIYRSASAARALRRRNDPMVIAVHRRRANKTIEGPGYTTRQQNSPRAPHIYKYTIKIIITPLATKSEGVNSFSLQNFFQSRNVYTRVWIIKRLFVYLEHENKNYGRTRYIIRTRII